MYITIIFIGRSNLSCLGSHLSMTPSPTATYEGSKSISASHRSSSKEISTAMLSSYLVKPAKPSSWPAFLQLAIFISAQIPLSIRFAELRCHGKCRIVLTTSPSRASSLFITTLFPFSQAFLPPALLSAGAIFFRLQDP